jgi:hypothetical protein
MKQFPPSPDYTIRTVSNFFENSRRYSQLKVCHRWQICRRCCWQRRQFCLRCRWCTLTCEYIPQWIFEKIQNGLNGIFWGWGKTDSWSKKFRDTVPLKIQLTNNSFLPQNFLVLVIAVGYYLPIHHYHPHIFLTGIFLVTPSVATSNCTICSNGCLCTGNKAKESLQLTLRCQHSISRACAGFWKDIFGKYEEKKFPHVKGSL